MRLSEAKRRYRGRWLAFAVTREANGDPKGTVIAAAKSRHELHAKLQGRRVASAYLTFAGPPVRPGYIAVFVLA